MVRLVAAILFMTSLAGCVELEEDTGGTGATTDACREGDGLFVKAQHHPGFIGPEYQWMFYTLQRDGRLVFFRAHDVDSTGSGKVTPQPGAMHNITTAEVRQEMQRVGISTTGRDINISVAYKDTVRADLFADFCSVVLKEFYSYKARYENNMIADCDAFEFTIATKEKGTHSSYSYCNEGPDGARKAFDRIRDASWDRFGLDGL